jgi:glutaminase
MAQPGECVDVHSSICDPRRVRTQYAPGAWLNQALAIGLLAVAMLGPAAARGPMGARDADFETAVEQAHKRYKSDRGGKVSESIAAVTSNSPDAYAIVVVRVDGKVFERGDSGLKFLLTATATPFTAALAAEQQGADLFSSAKGAVAGTVPLPNARGSSDWGLAPTAALELDGSLATLSLVQPQKDAEGKWRALLENFGKFAGAELAVDQRAYKAAKPVVPRLPQQARQLGTDGRLKDDADITADLYLRQNTVSVTARELAIMAATLANDGVNPVQQKRVVTAATAQAIAPLLAAKRKGQSAWMSKEGILAIAGSSGAIMIVLPGRLGIATYAPPLDAGGVSVRGQRAVKYLSQALMFNP